MIISNNIEICKIGQQYSTWLGTISVYYTKRVIFFSHRILYLMMNCSLA